MRLDYRIPMPLLRPYLTVYAFIENSGARIFETIPAMLPNLHIRIAGETTYHFHDRAPVCAPRVSLIGATTRCYGFEASPDAKFITIGFLPLGWLTLFRLPAFEVVDGVVDGGAVWDRALVDELCCQILQCSNDRERQAVLEGFLLGQLGRATACPLTDTAAAIDDWLERSSDLSLDPLMEQLDVGARHLRRLTLQTHGMSPKRLAMKYRTLRAAAAYVTSDAQDLETQATLLFSDQSHLIRDFRQFVGWTPGAFTGASMNLAAATLQGRRRAGVARPLALLS